MTTFRRGFVVGKFYPLHAGHQNLIRFAQQSCEELEVHVYESYAESIPATVRADWIRREHPGVTVVSATDNVPVDFDDPAIWDAHMEIMRATLTAPIDVVFSGDDYGAEMASRLGAQWVQVDPGRIVAPASGTAVRSDVAGNWWALSPTVREWFCRRVVVLGAESTGTTTLAQALTRHYGTPEVSEFGRQWSMDRPGGLHEPWTSAEFDFIACQHRQREIEAMRSSAIPLVISDTDNLATAIWHERYLGRPSPSVLATARDFPPDLYILTGDDIPFVQDGWRDGEHIRHQMHQRFRVVLEDCGVPWLEVRGSHEQRLSQAIARIDKLMSDGWDLGEPLTAQRGESHLVVA